MLLASGSLSLLLILVVPNYTNGHDVVVAAVDAAAIVVGAACLVLPRRIPIPFMYGLPALGTVLICTAMFFSRTVSDGSELLLIWPVLFSGYFLPWSVGWASVALVAGVYTPVAIRVEGLPGITPAVHVAGTSVVTLLIVASLRSRLTRVLEASQREARTDALTGLLNRRAFDESSAREVARCQRERRPLALLLVDLDHFKELNDRHGHPAGDSALRRVASLLGSQTRESDVLARFGGEEFALLLPACAEADAISRAQQLRRLVEEVFQDWVRPLTVSVGVAVFPAHASDLPHLIALADLALYRAKHSGRNAVEVAPEPEPTPKA